MGVKRNKNPNENKNGNHTKKGPGRFHMQGKPVAPAQPIMTLKAGAA